MKLAEELGVAEAYADRYPYASFALAIASLRGELLMTQQQLADLVGTKLYVISRAESGRWPVSVALLTRIAKATKHQIVITVEFR